MNEQQLNRAERDVFEALRDTHGKALRAQHVLEVARAPENPLHKHFDWNDSSAAEKYRLQQAGQLIVRARVIVEKRYSEPTRVRPAAPAPKPPISRYQPPTPLRAVKPENDGSAKLFAEGVEELKAFRGKYSGERRFNGIFLEIERLANPQAIGTNVLQEAAALALRLEGTRGCTRQEACSRAAVAFNVDRFAVMEAVRKVG